MPRSRSAALIACALLCAGCATIPWRPSGRPARPPSAEFRDYYAQPTITLSEHRAPLTTEPSSRWLAQRVTLSAPGMAHPIRLDWYAPPPAGGAPRPAVLIFPILWGNDLGVREFAKGFARQGIHGIIVYRPKEKFSMEKPLSQLEDHFRTTVQQARQVVDWLETQPAVDATRLGSLGISMGASLNVLVAAAEPRITRYVFCMPASHIAHVTMTTKDRSIANKRHEYLARYGLTPEAAEQALTQVLRSEPLTAAPAIDPKRSLAVIALADRVIGRRNSLEIWRALGRPPTIWLPTGHYTALFALPYVKLKVLWFFADWSGEGAAAPQTALTRPARTMP